MITGATVHRAERKRRGRKVTRKPTTSRRRTMPTEWRKKQNKEQTAENVSWVRDRSVNRREIINASCVKRTYLTYIKMLMEYLHNKRLSKKKRDWSQRNKNNNQQWRRKKTDDEEEEEPICFKSVLLLSSRERVKTTTANKIA